MLPDTQRLYAISSFKRSTRHTITISSATLVYSSSCLLLSIEMRAHDYCCTRKTSPSATMRGLPAAPPPPLASLATPPHAARFARPHPQLLAPLAFSPPRRSLRSHSAPLHCKTTSIGLGTSYKAAYKCVMQNGLNWPLSSVQDNQWLLPVTLQPIEVILVTSDLLPVIPQPI